MNAAEQLIQVYFQHVKQCFTAVDIKVINGNGRQLDLLAFDKREERCYHVETSVTHTEAFGFNTQHISSLFDKKFFGVPPKNDKPTSDWMRGKNYRTAIENTYAQYGVEPSQVIRLCCVWALPGTDEDCSAMLKNIAIAHNIDSNTVKLMSLRDLVVPSLKKTIGTSNYDDVILRVISLMAQAEKQSQKTP